MIANTISLTESQLINYLEIYTTRYLNLLDNPQATEERMACKELIDEIVEEFGRRRYAV
jgi:hypothetical protein